MIEMNHYKDQSAFFYWTIQYGSNIEVLEPESMRERIKKAALDIYKMYK